MNNVKNIKTMNANELAIHYKAYPFAIYGPVFPAYCEKKSKPVYGATIDMFMLAPIVEYRLEKFGSAGAFQRPPKETIVKAIAESETDIAKLKQRKTRAAFSVVYTSIICAIPSALVWQGMIYIPISKEAIAAWAEEFHCVDGQHRVLAHSTKVSQLPLGTQVNMHVSFMVDATEQEIAFVFDEINANATKVSSALLNNHNFVNGCMTESEAYAMRVIRALSDSFVDIGDGKVASEIHENVNYGWNEGEFNALKLKEALSKYSDLWAYAQKNKKSFEAIVQDMFKLLRAWCLINAEYGGTSALFGEVKSRKKKANQFFKIKETEMSACARTGRSGLALANTYYIFSTAAAVLQYLDELKYKHTVESMRLALSVLYTLRIKTCINKDNKALIGNGGVTCMVMGQEDSARLLQKAEEFKKNVQSIEEKGNKANAKTRVRKVRA